MLKVGVRPPPPPTFRLTPVPGQLEVCHVAKGASGMSVLSFLLPVDLLYGKVCPRHVLRFMSQVYGYLVQVLRQ